MINITEEYKKAMAMLDALGVPQDQDGERMTLTDRISVLNARHAKMLIKKLELHMDPDIVSDTSVTKDNRYAHKESDINFAWRMLKEGKHVYRTSAPSITYWLESSGYIICSLDIDNPWYFTREESEAEDWTVVGSTHPTTELPARRIEPHTSMPVEVREPFPSIPVQHVPADLVDRRNEGSSIPPDGKVFFKDEYTGKTTVVEPLPPLPDTDEE